MPAFRPGHRRRLLTSTVGILLVVATAAIGAPGSSPQPSPAGVSPLRAGAASGLLRVPIGAPLGGYLRPPVGGDYLGADPQAEATDALPTEQAADGTPLAPVPDEARKAHTTYATYSPPSRGYYDALTVKAVALDDGTDVAVLVKGDLIGSLDEVTVAVAEQVKSQSGVDVAKGLVLSATHTHDGPGAVANDSVRYFWLAMDAYQPELFDRLVGDIAAVVVEALHARVPARFGFGTGQESRASSLNSFRRSRAPWPAARVALQDALRRRIGVLAVDEVDDDGNVVRPIALVTNYASHGIVFDVENLYFSGDALAAVEREIEASYDQPMVAMFVQNTGGDVSPRADGKPPLQRIERFGKLLAPQVLSIAASIDNFETSPDIAAVSQRIKLNRQALGYAEGEYPYEHGAVQCNAQAATLPERCIPAPPPDQADLLDNGAAENGSFVPLDTRLTALRIGDAVLLAQPGEPLAEYGLRILETSPFGYDRTFIWGYSQDHIGYLLPDSKADWMLGGTEGTTTFWGWKQGARLLRANQELLAALAGTAPAPADELAVAYSRRPYTPMAATPSARPGRVVTQPVAIKRFEATTFRFEGGDPVVDLPPVRVERQVDGQWIPVRRPNGQIMDTPYETHLRYGLVSGVHQWTVDFEAPKDWTAGTYRFVAKGVAAPTGSPYSAASAPFSVSPSNTLQLSPVTRVGDTVEVTVGYTPRPTNYRLIDAEVPADKAAPMRSGVVTFDAGGLRITDDTPEFEVRGGLLVAVYRATLPGAVTAAAADVWGNTSS